MENILRAFEKSRAEGKPGAVDRTSASGPAGVDSNAPDAGAPEAGSAELRETQAGSTARLEAESAAARASARTIDDALASIAEAKAAATEIEEDAPPLLLNETEVLVLDQPAGFEESSDTQAAPLGSERPGGGHVSEGSDSQIAIPVSPLRQAFPVRKAGPGLLGRAGIAVLVPVGLVVAGVFLVQTDPQVAAAWDEFRLAFQQQAALLGEWAGRVLDLD